MTSEPEKRKAVIMCGLPGAGKSTYVKKHFPDAVVCASDDQFFQADGSYAFDPDQLQTAHDKCWLKFYQAMQDNEPLIVIDNISVGLDELGSYRLPAIANRYEVEIIVLMCDVRTSIRRNTKAVPSFHIGMWAERLRITLATMPDCWERIIIDMSD